MVIGHEVRGERTVPVTFHAGFEGGCEEGCELLLGCGEVRGVAEGWGRHCGCGGCGCSGHAYRSGWPDESLFLKVFASRSAALFWHSLGS